MFLFEFEFHWSFFPMVQMALLAPVMARRLLAIKPLPETQFTDAYTRSSAPLS